MTTGPKRTESGSHSVVQALPQPDFEKMRKDLQQTFDSSKISTPPKSEGTVAHLGLAGIDLRVKDTPFTRKIGAYILMGVFGFGGGAAAGKAMEKEIPPGVLSCPSELAVERGRVAKLEERANRLELDSDEVLKKKIPRIEREHESLVVDVEKMRKRLPE